MAYEVTAIKRRPQVFSELAGQEFVSSTLTASLENNRIAHAYLFSGPRGCGKTSTARILAKALNCEKGPTANPCGECPNCISIRSGSSLDVIEIDGASNNSVDNVREIKDEVLFPPNMGHYKIYIIDEVHMLSNSAFNALLKTIEEPPPYIVFIFATTEPHKVPATIKSRCQQFSFRLIPHETIKTLLANTANELGVKAEDEALAWIAKESTGSMRDAYTLFDQAVSFSNGNVTMELLRSKLGLSDIDQLNNLYEAAISRDRNKALSILDELLSFGITIEQFINDSANYFRSLLLIKSGIKAASILGNLPSSFSVKILEELDTNQIEHALACFFDLHRSIRYSLNPGFELELEIAKLCSLKDFISPNELAKTIEALRTAAWKNENAKENLTGKTEIENSTDQKKKIDTLNSGDLLHPCNLDSENRDDNWMEKLRNSVISALEKSNFILAESLRKSTCWSEKDGLLSIHFPGEYETRLVKQDSETVLRFIREIGQKALRVEFCIASKMSTQNNDGNKTDLDQVSIVEKVFNGQRISKKQNLLSGG